MSENAENIRETLVKGASSHKIAERVIAHAIKNFGPRWAGSAIMQLAILLKIDIPDASSLVSEHCTVPIRK